MLGNTRDVDGSKKRNYAKYRPIRRVGLSIIVTLLLVIVMVIIIVLIEK